MSVVEEDASAPDEPSRPAVVVPLHRRLPGGRTLRDGHRLYWWGELLAVLIFYGVYSFVRNLHHGNEARGLPARQGPHRRAEGARHQPRAGDPGVGTRLARVHHRAQLLLRLAALHRDRRRHDLPVPALDRRLPPLAQHARHRHRPRAHRLRLLPAAAAAAPRQLQPGAPPRDPLRVRRHAGQGPDVLVVQLRRGEQDLEPVRGDAQRPLRLGAVVRVRARAAAEARRGRRSSPRSTR